MNAKSISLAAALGWAGAITSFTQTVSWNGAGDGVSWSDPLNWSGGQVPGPTNDVVISGGTGTNLVISSGPVTIQSIQCAKSLTVSDGSFTVLAGTSTISGPCTIAGGRTLAASGANTILTVSGTTVADGANLFASNGAALSLPALRQYAAPPWPSVVFTWQASGTSSVLSLANVTNVTGNAQPAGYLQIEALGGGRIELGQVVDMNAGWDGSAWWTPRGIQVLADGTNSMVDLTSLARFLSPVPVGGSSLESRNAGVLLTGNLKEISGTSVGGTVDIGTIQSVSACTFLFQGSSPATSQMKNIVNGSLTADGVAADLSGVTNLSGTTLMLTNGGTANVGSVANIDGASFYVSGGVTLSLPSVRFCDEPDSGNTTFTWQASGAGTLLRLANLTNLVGDAQPAGYLQIEALSGGRIELGQVIEMNAGWDGSAWWTPRGIQVLADGTNSMVDLTSLARFLSPVPVGGSSLESRNAGVLLTGNLKEISGTSVAGTAGIGTIQSVTGCAFVFRGNSPATGQMKSIVNGTLTADAVAVDLSGVTNLSGTTLVLSNGGTANVGSVANIDGASFYVSGGVMLSLPSVRSCDEPDSGNTTFTWQASGVGSLLRFANLTNLVGDAEPAGYLQIEALGGGRIELGQVIEMNAGWDGSAWWTPRGIQVLADGTNSMVDLTSLARFLSPVPAGGSSLESRNAGVLLTGNLKEISGTSVAGTVDIGTIQSVTGCAFVFRGSSPATSQMKNIVNGNLTADAVAVDLSGVTNLSGTILVLTNGGTATAGSVANIDGASFYVSGGVMLSLPSVRSCDEPDSGNTTFKWQASGAGSLLRLANLTNLFGDAEPAGYLQIEALGGGRIELGQVIEMNAGWDGSAWWTPRGIQVLADGTNSVVDLSLLAQFLNPGPTGGSILAATNAGTILDASLATLTGTTLMLDSSGTFPTDQFQKLNGCSVVVKGVSRTFPILTNLDGSSFTVQNGGFLSLTNFPFLMVSNSALSFTATGTGSLIDLTMVTNLIVGAGGRLDVNASDGGKVDLRMVESVTGGSANFVADGAGSVIDLTRLSSFLTPQAASSLIAKNDGVVLINRDTVFLLANVAVTLPGLIAQPSPAMVLQGHAWHSYWVERRDTRQPGSPWMFLARVAQTNSIQAFASAPPPDTAFRVWEFVADPPVLDLNRAPARTAQLILFAPANQTYRIESASELNEVWEPGEIAAMTNSFRIFTPEPLDTASHFFRARKL